MAQPKGKQFRGLATPRNIDKQTAFMLEQISRHLRTVPGSEPSLTGFLGPQDNNIFAPSDGQVRKAGGLSDLPPVPHGTTTTWTFPTGTYVPSTAMLQLAGGYYQKTANDTLTLRSDGSRYYEIGRAGNPTFIPASNWGAIPDSGQDVTDAIQLALDSVPTGSVLYFDPGTYQIDGSLSCTTSNITIWLAPGAVLAGNHTSAAANLLTVEGSEGAVTANLVSDLVERQFTSVNIATANFLADDWVVIEDDQTASIDPTPRHMEINRIKSIDDATHLTLYYPVADSYTTARTGRITTCTPVENVHVTGGGVIRNHGTDATSGGHGLKFDLCVNPGASEIIIEDVRNQALKFEECRALRASNVLLRDAPIFYASGGNGYGVTTTSCVDGIIDNCFVYRTRHAYDISFFSRDISVNGCHTYGNAFSGYQVHPNCKRIYFNDCLVDGVSGYDNATGAVMTDTENQGHGFSVREDCTDIHWNGGLIANTILSGASLDHTGCSHVSVRNTVIYRSNLRGVINQAGIYANERDNSSNSLDDLVIENNLIIYPYVVGIYATFNNARINGNIIYDPLKGNTAPTAFISGSPSSHAWGILIAPRDYSGVALSGGVISGIETRGNKIYCFDNDGCEYGIQFGGAEFLASNPSVDNTVELTYCKSIDDYVYGANLSGFRMTPATKTGGGKTAIISLATGNALIRPIAELCNRDDNNDNAGIVVANQNAVTMTQSCDVYGAMAFRNTRTGIIVGFNDQRVEDCTAHDQGVFGGGGIGIHVRNFAAADVLSNVRLDRAVAHNNPIEGIRVSSASGVGTSVSVQLTSPVCRENGSYGINILDLASETVISNPETVSNGTSGIFVQGDTTKILTPKSYDITGAQNYGIDIAAAADATVIFDPWLDNNGTSAVRDLGTNTQFHNGVMRIADAGNANHTMALPYTHVRWGTALTAPRLQNLPAATMVGMRVRVTDDGAINGANTITVTRAGADLIDGVAAPAACVLAVAFASIDLEVVATGRWKIV